MDQGRGDRSGSRQLWHDIMRGEKKGGEIEIWVLSYLEGGKFLLSFQFTYISMQFIARL